MILRIKDVRGKPDQSRYIGKVIHLVHAISPLRHPGWCSGIVCIDEVRVYLGDFLIEVSDDEGYPI